MQAGGAGAVAADAIAAGASVRTVPTNAASNLNTTQPHTIKHTPPSQ